MINMILKYLKTIRYDFVGWQLGWVQLDGSYSGLTRALTCGSNQLGSLLLLIDPAGLKHVSDVDDGDHFVCLQDLAG